MTRRLGAIAVVLALVAAPIAAFAASPWTQEVDYLGKVKGKFVYGLKNGLLGWTEIFSEPAEAIQGGGNFFLGIGEGLFNCIGQTVGGALHVATFPIPQIDVPLPEGGTQLLQ